MFLEFFFELLTELFEILNFNLSYWLESLTFIFSFSSYQLEVEK